MLLVLAALVVGFVIGKISNPVTINNIEASSGAIIVTNKNKDNLRKVLDYRRESDRQPIAQ